MKRIFIPFLVASLFILAGCSAPVRIYTDIAESANFEQYSTYNFLDFTEGNKKTITQMERERIRVAIARELEERGLDFVEKGADVSVQITVYHREARNHFYGYPGVYHYMQRAIAVDIYDNRTRDHVWHSAAVGQLDYDPGERAERLPEVAEKIFQDYPVKPAVQDPGTGSAP
jgi:hypothetical protein